MFHFPIPSRSYFEELAGGEHPSSYSRCFRHCRSSRNQESFCVRGSCQNLGASADPVSGKQQNIRALLPLPNFFLFTSPLRPSESLVFLKTLFIVICTILVSTLVIVCISSTTCIVNCIQNASRSVFRRGSGHPMGIV